MQLDKVTVDAAEFKAGFDKVTADAAEFKAGFDKLTVDTVEQKAQVSASLRWRALCLIQFLASNCRRTGSLW